MRHRKVAFVAAAAVLVSSLLVAGGPVRAEATCAPEAAGGDWPMMNHDVANSRNQSEESSLGPAQAATLEPAWTFDANAATGVPNNEITGYPIVADGCVFVGTSTGFQTPGYLIALNADTGDVVWQRQVEHGIYSSAAVADGLVYVFVSRVGDALSDDTRGPSDDCEPLDLPLPGHDRETPVCGPYVLAVDQDTGETVWETTVDYQYGSDAVSSPVVFDGMVWVGISGTAAEGTEEERPFFRGTSVLLDAATGELLVQEYTVPDADLIADGSAGGALWSTIAVDAEEKYGYAGTGNPFNYEHEHPRTNAILKIDVDPSRDTFGRVVGSYKGDVEEYFPQVSENFSCDEDDPIGFFFAGFECGRLDVDFGASAQIFELTDGTKVAGEGQKSGVYHTVARDAFDDDPMTNEAVWTQVVGVPSLVGGIVGTPAYDGQTIYTPHTIAGYIVALDKDTGAHKWVAPVGDGIHWGNPVTYANGVVYANDLNGFLNAFDAATGAQLLKRPLALGAGTNPAEPMNTWGGTTVARNTVYSTVGVGITSAQLPVQMPNGFVQAFRPSGLL